LIETKKSKKKKLTDLDFIDLVMIDFLLLEPFAPLIDLEAFTSGVVGGAGTGPGAGILAGVSGCRGAGFVAPIGGAKGGTVEVAGTCSGTNVLAGATVVTIAVVGGVTGAMAGGATGGVTGAMAGGTIGASVGVAGETGVAVATISPVPLEVGPPSIVGASVGAKVGAYVCARNSFLSYIYH